MRKVRMRSRKLAQSIALAVTLAAALAVATQSAQAQTFMSLHSFDYTDGDMPTGLVQATDGNFYGTTSSGGSALGTVFKITPGGTLTTIHSFDGTDGQDPLGRALVQATDGNFYGTTQNGGVNGFGTVFKITPSGTLTTLYSFCPKKGCIDGRYPAAGLIQATDGNFYGTTYGGPASSACPSGCGTVFAITPSGTLTILHTFDGTDGENPEAALIQASDGNFYGTTLVGGINAAGTVFKITASGTFTNLHTFDITDGEYPSSEALIQATDGNLYGTTINGGPENAGTIFQITPSGTLTTFHNFDGSDGESPAAIVQASDGNFYGTTALAGGGDGTIFEITPSGTLTTLHSFGGTDGNDAGDLIQSTNGTFYGTTSFGGTNRYGTVFSLSVGLGPFVSLVPDVGLFQKTIGILGQGFTGTTGVSFNGAPANFNVVSDTYLTASVPLLATTGPVTVMTPGGTLTSNRPFLVLATAVARP